MKIEEAGTESEPTVGETLRQARRERGLTLEDAERTTQIRAGYLKALERGDFGGPTRPAYVQGILKIYAEYLGLEAEMLLARYLESDEKTAPEPEHPVSSRWAAGGVSRALRRVSRRWRLTAALAVVVAVATVVLMPLLFPYGPIVGRIADLADALFPDTFLDSGPQHVLVMASSPAVAGEPARTDNVMLSKVAEDGLGLLAIPKNTRTEIPGHATDDLGRAFELKGPDLTRRSVSRLTGVEVPNHLVISMEGVKEIVDSVGGVQTYVPEPMRGRAPDTGAEVMLQPGVRVLDGDQAVLYLHWDGDEQNVAERVERQQRFLAAVFRQAFTPPHVFSTATRRAVFENADTNMGAVELVQLAGRVRALENAGVPQESATIPGRTKTAYSPSRDEPVSYWVTDDRELQAVLRDTVISEQEE